MVGSKDEAETKVCHTTKWNESLWRFWSQKLPEFIGSRFPLKQAITIPRLSQTVLCRLLYNSSAQSTIAFNIIKNKKIH